MECKCKTCGKKFTRSLKHVKYCSLACSIKFGKQTYKIYSEKRKAEKILKLKKENICEQCKKSFIPDCNMKQKFCTKECSTKWMNEGWLREDKH